ncbi:hypothetical protein D1871_19305 [Nakamurella silvestris]|nr:hypothetical protein D1871_19305 [Nakamurella silvestris]
MKDWTLADIRAYYQLHASLLAPHLFGRLVRTYPPGGDDVTVSSVDAFLALVDTGVGGFAVPPHRLDDAPDSVDRLVVHLRTGEGADIATAAMAAQAVAEHLATDGVTAVATTDGADGFILLAAVPSQPLDRARSQVDLIARALAARAPEIATTAAGESQGRVYVDTSATDPTVFTPIPYSLVPGDGAGVVMPVTLDEVSAASAGMPLDPEPGDVADRLAVWADLTRQLHG